MEPLVQRDRLRHHHRDRTDEPGVLDHRLAGGHAVELQHIIDVHVAEVQPDPPLRAMGRRAARALELTGTAGPGDRPPTTRSLITRALRLGEPRARAPTHLRRVPGRALRRRGLSPAGRAALWRRGRRRFLIRALGPRSGRAGAYRAGCRVLPLGPGGGEQQRCRQPRQDGPGIAIMPPTLVSHDSSLPYCTPASPAPSCWDR